MACKPGIAYPYCFEEGVGEENPQYCGMEEAPFRRSQMPVCPAAVKSRLSDILFALSIIKKENKTQQYNEI